MKIPAVECALLVIDMQNGFVHPQSGMGTSQSGTGSQQAILPALGELVAFCRGAGVPVLWSKQEHYHADVTRARKRLRPHSARQGFLPCLRGTWETEFYEGVLPLIHPDDPVVHKHRASVFYNTNLETKLRMLGATTLLLAGCNTEFCVESTVRDAYARDFDILVARDCVAGIDPRFHDNSLRVFEAYFGEVLTNEKLRGVLE
jgi:ureidoacrylate peracid hydrolase